MNNKHEQAFLDFHHKTKVLPDGWTPKDIYKSYFMAGLALASEEREVPHQLHRDLAHYKWICEGHEKELEERAKRIAELEATDEKWNQEVTKWQALAQERLVGQHHCPDWDEMELKPGYIEFAACLCKPETK